MLAQQGYDYTKLALDIAPNVEQAATFIRQHRDNISISIIAIGNQLRQTKDQLPHGEWGKWLELEFNWSDRQARRFMQVAERFGGKTDNLSNFGMSALYMLASEDEEVIDEALKRANEGEYISNAIAKEMVAERKQSQSAGVVWVEDETEAAPDETVCIICGERSSYENRGKWYCAKHFIIKCKSCESLYPRRFIDEDGNCYRCQKAAPVQVEDETEVAPAQDETEVAPAQVYTCYCGQKARHRVDGEWYCDHHVPVRPCPTCGRATMSGGECHSCANQRLVYKEKHEVVAEPEDEPVQFREYTIKRDCGSFVVAKDGHEIRLQTRGHAERFITCCYTATAPAGFDKDIDQAAAWDFKLKTQPEETWEVQEEARNYIASIDAEMAAEEIPPDVVYYKILCFGAELSLYAKNALRALGKEFESLEYMQHVPNSEEMQAVVEEHFDVLFGDIASRALFAGDES